MDVDDQLPFTFGFQSVWKTIYDYYNGDPFTLNVWGSIIASVGWWWILNLFFIVIDLCEGPQFITKYKIQPNEKPSMHLFMKSLAFATSNQIIGIPVIIVAHYTMQWRGCDFGPELPSVQKFIFDLTICICIEEVGFYYFHRMFHHPRLYKPIHKVHHEMTAPISINSMCMHPIEHLANLITPLLGPLVCGSHISTGWVWYCLAMGSITISHCGYHLPFLPSPEAHDYHHLKFTNCFGVLGVLDWCHGTDVQFRKSKAFHRHRVLLSFTPVSESIPD